MTMGTPIPSGYRPYVSMPRRLTDRALREMRDRKRPLPTLYRSPERWIERLLEERAAARRARRKAQGREKVTG